jgi:hypothetical protein
MQYDALIDRALSLLAFMSAKDAVDHLVESGVDLGEAFLAVQAAEILARDIR